MPDDPKPAADTPSPTQAENDAAVSLARGIPDARAERVEREERPDRPDRPDRPERAALGKDDAADADEDKDKETKPKMTGTVDPVHRTVPSGAYKNR